MKPDRQPSPSHLPGERGVALLVTLAVVSVLVTVTVELNRSTRSSVESAAATRDRITLNQAAASGVHAAMAMLVKDQHETQIDSVQEDWADPEKVAEVVEAVATEDVDLFVSITDELSLIQVNALAAFPDGREFNASQRRLWERFLGLLFLDAEDMGEEEVSTIINSLKDWLDSGDDDAITGLSGAEADYYESLDPPCAIGNGPMRHINEFLRVRGVDAAFFAGTTEAPGAIQCLTVHGIAAQGDRFTFPGKININTAPLAVLASLLPPEDVELAPTLYEYRIEKAEDGSTFARDLSSPVWYTQPPGCAELKIDAELITTTSDLFRIVSTARKDAMVHRITTVVRRTKNPQTGQGECLPLSWETN